MAKRSIGVIMNGVTGRMGMNQHLIRSIVAIRAQGGVTLPDGDVLMPDPILLGRNEEKLRAHRTPVLHRAFSVFVLDEHGAMLLQRRAAGKYHSAGLWSNACCGHPRPGEPVAAAAERRLAEEMGIRCPLVPAGSVSYSLDVGDGLREDEFNRPAGSGTVDSTIQNFLGGIQVKNNEHDGPRFKPFGHALFGVAHQKLDVDSPQLPAVFGISDFHVNETSFAMAFGGGVDIKLNHRIDVRAGQVDWNIIRRGDQQIGGFTLPNTRQDNLRLSIGIVIH